MGFYGFLWENMKNLFEFLFIIVITSVIIINYN